MTATRTAPAPSTYVSGFCGSRRHDRCRGGYAGVQCTCGCHTAPPEPVYVEPEPVPLDPAALFATVSHSAGVASVGYAGKLAQAVCSCGWAAPDPRTRNHDAFDDARAHLSEAAGEVAA